MSTSHAPTHRNTSTGSALRALLTVVAMLAALAAVKTNRAAGQHAGEMQLMSASPQTRAAQLARCPRSADRYASVMKDLVISAVHARALASANPLLEANAAFYESEIAATRACMPAVAVLITR